MNELEMIFRVVLAGIFGGIIGFERESTKRPAGFRTHTLVCIGSALVMVTSEFIFLTYGSGSTDIARLGAQVISGIGFLGAGTIIRDRFKVRGLTTAASLWAVACVGLAVGIGYYYGAAAVTFLIFTVLHILKRIEGKIGKYSIKINKCYITCSKSVPIDGMINCFKENDCNVEKIDFVKNKKGKRQVNVLFKSIDEAKVPEISAKLSEIDEIDEIFFN